MARLALRVRGGVLFCSCALACTDGTRVGADSDVQVDPTPAVDSAVGGDAGVGRAVRVLLAATVVTGTGGSSNAGIAGVAGDAGIAGTAGVAGSSSLGNCRSVYCGDGCRDTTKEECDEGVGSPGKFCNWACQVQENWASHSETTVPSGSRVTRRLGRGRHPLAANESRWALGLVEQITPAEQQIRVAVHNDLGAPIVDAVMSGNTWVADRADPVVAVLGNGDVVTAYTEFGGDGDGLGIALRRIRAGLTTPDPVVWASSPNFAAQYDADILALSDRILVAYTDEYDAVSGPDITLREFGLDLKPIGSAKPLGATSDVEGRVALAKLGTSWGAAWRRAAADGSESIDVYDAATGAQWSVGPHMPADGDDLPALVALDSTRRLLLYVRDAAPPSNQIAMTGQLCYAVLNTAQSGTPVSNAPVSLAGSAYANYVGLSTRRPTLVTAGTDFFMGWSTAQRTADPSFFNGEEVWFEGVTPALSGTGATFTYGGELTMPRWTAGRVGDQRVPAMTLLGPGTNQPGAALVSAWEDDGETLGTGSGEPEVVVQVTPLSLRRDATTPATDCSTTALCAAGKGKCLSSNQCQSGLACGFVSGGISNGPSFGYGTDVGVCVAPHCIDHTQNSGETGVDCGGTDCGACLCGDRIVSTEVGEVCDTAGNSATCDSDCTAPSCGDGLVNTSAGEECDLGAGNGPTSACLPNCTRAVLCSDGASCFGVSTQSVASSTSQIGVNLKIVNNSAQAQSLNGVTLRYWFTADGTAAYALACDSSASIPCSSISGVESAFTPARVDADRVMIITLNTSLSLSPHQDSGTIQLRLVNQAGATPNKLNDYSYSTSVLDANLSIGMYRAGTLVWGRAPTATYACGNGITEPGEVCDNAANTRCRSDCTGFNVVNGTACTNAAQCLSLEQYWDASSTDTYVRPYLRIVNRSGVAVALNRMKIRYWFSSESTTATFTKGCFSGPTGSCTPVTTAVTRLSPSFPTADVRLSATFSSTTPIGLASQSPAFQNYARRSDGVVMNQTNDWSQTGATSFTVAPRVALYVDDLLWWGEEPK